MTVNLNSSVAEIARSIIDEQSKEKFLIESVKVCGGMSCRIFTQGCFRECLGVFDFLIPMLNDARAYMEPRWISM